MSRNNNHGGGSSSGGSSFAVLMELDGNNKQTSSNSLVTSLSASSSIKERSESLRQILNVPKNLLSEQLHHILEPLKKILTQASSVATIQLDQVEYYCTLLRVVKYLASEGGEKVANKLGNDTDVIPIVLFLAFDANVNHSTHETMKNMASDHVAPVAFISEEIVSLACSALYALSEKVDDNRVMIRESKGLKNLLDLIRVYSNLKESSKEVSAECRRRSLLVLEKFCLNASNKSLFPIINGIQIVIDQMKHAENFVCNAPKTVQEDVKMSNFGIIEAGIRVLYVLCLGNKKNEEEVCTKCPLTPLMRTILNTLNFSQQKSSKKAIFSADSYRTLTVQDGDFSELLSCILFLVSRISKKENRKEELLNINTVLKEEGHFLEMALSLICYLYSSSSTHSDNNYIKRSFTYAIDMLSSLSSIEKVRKELIVQKDSKTKSSKYFNYYTDKKSLNGAQVLLHQFSTIGTIQKHKSLQDTEDRSFSENVLYLFTRLGEYSFKDLYDFVGMKTSQVMTQISGIVQESQDVLILQHCLRLITMYFSKEGRSLSKDAISDDLLKKASESIIMVLEKKLGQSTSFTSTMYVQSENSSAVEIARLQFMCFTAFNCLDMKDLTIWKLLIDKAQKAIPVHRLCDWILQTEISESTSRILFTILEILNQLVQSEKADLRDIATLGISPKLINMLDFETFQDISIYFIYNISFDSVFKQSFINNGGLKKLLKLLKEKDEHSNDVLKIMYNFAKKDRSTKIAIAECGCLGYLLEKLTKDTKFSDKFFKNSVALIQVLSEVPSLATFIASYDIVPVVLKQSLSSDSCAILEYATNLLSAIVTVPGFEQGRNRATENVKDLITLLRCDVPEIQENCINIFSNLASYSQYQSSLRDSGLITELQNLVEGDNQYLSLLSQLAVNNFNLENKKNETLRNRILSVSKSENDFQSKKEAIEKQYVKRYENEIKKESIMWNSLTHMTNNAYEKLTIEINWDFFDELKAEGEKRRAFHLLKDHSWRNLRESISLFCDQSPLHNRAFLTCINILIVEFDYSSYLAYKGASTKIISDSQSSTPSSARRPKAFTSIKIQTQDTIYQKYVQKYGQLGVLFYNIGYDDMNTMSKEDFVSSLNNLLEGDLAKIKEITPKSLLNDKERSKMRPFANASNSSSDLSESSRGSSGGSELGLSPLSISGEQLKLSKNPIALLKEQCKEAHKGPLYLQTVVSLIQSKYFTKYSKKDEEAIEGCFKKIKTIEENYIKGYKTTKINKEGYKQQRFLIVTDKFYHTVKYDFSKKEVDLKHTKSHDLTNLFVIDIGTFDKTSSPCLVIFTKEKSSKKKSTLKSKKTMLKSGSDIDIGNHLSEQERVQGRPSTDNCYSNIFCGLDDTLSLSATTPGGASSSFSETMRAGSVGGDSGMSPHSDEANKVMLEEIAWTIFAAASCAQGQLLFEPFSGRAIEKPKQGITSFIYNKLKFGNLK